MNSIIFDLNKSLSIKEDIILKNEKEFKQEMDNLGKIIDDKNKEIIQLEDEINNLKNYVGILNNNINEDQKYIKHLNGVNIQLVEQLEKIVDRNKKIKNIIDNKSMDKFNQNKDNINQLINSLEKRLNIK